MRGVVPAWALVGICLALTSRLSAEHLWVVSLLPLAVWAVAGVVILVLQLWRARVRAQRPSSLWRAGAIVAAFALFVPMATLGGWATERARFLWHRSHYKRVVAQVEAHPPASRLNSDRGLEYFVDAGPPTRVAFPWPGGLVDNWCGIVHDRSGEVLQINALERGSDSWRSSAVTALFGGDMIACHIVEEPYYLCCFT